MSTDLQQDGPTPARSLLPPYLVVSDFLPEDTVAALIDFALAHEASFVPTRVGREPGGSFNPLTRVSSATRDLGPFAKILRSELRARVPNFLTRLGATQIKSAVIELELVSHNDGAFYSRHIDTQTASDRDRIRVLSAVYYFNMMPKAFSGGALRLHAIGASGNHVDVEPAHNSLVIFPSWAPHEVMPVCCPSLRFADSRFAINCWIYRIKAEGSV